VQRVDSNSLKSNDQSGNIALCYLNSDSRKSSTNVSLETRNRYIFLQQLKGNHRNITMLSYATAHLKHFSVDRLLISILMNYFV
jgi:hypothetical protein